MKAAWFVRARQMESRFAFWLSFIGYNRRDRSLSHRIYLVYAIVFLSFWGFGVLALLAGTTAGLLKLFAPTSPAEVAARLATLILTAWGIYSIYQVSRRSPVVFSEDDSYLICATPVSRQAVALAWFPADWLESALPFWAGMVTLGFALAEFMPRSPGGLLDFPSYVWMGLRALLTLVPLHAGWLALFWALGVYRLRGDREPAWMRRYLPLACLMAALFLVVLVVRSGAGSLAGSGWLGLPGWMVDSLLFYLRGAFGLTSWGAVMAAGVLLLAVGLLALWLVSDRLSLSRAAQESTSREARQAAARSGAFDLARSQAQRQRLGIGHTPTRLLSLPGLWVMPWKLFIQTGRIITFGEVLSWVTVAISAAGMCLLPAWEARLLAAVFWAASLGQAATRSLKNDLERWNLLRQLPFPTARLLASSLAGPLVLGWLISTLAALPVVWYPDFFSVLAFILLPAVSASVVFLAAQDVIRQSRVSGLMNGNAATLGARGLLFSMIAILLPVGLIFLLGRSLGVVLALPSAIGLAFLSWTLASDAFRNIE